MELFSQPQECDITGEIAIIHYQLDFQKKGDRLFYVWRHRPAETDDRRKVAVLIDLSYVYVPDFEIDKMVCGFLAPGANVVSIAFAHCHPHNQQEIKRKLKAGDVALYSNTALFPDVEQAKHWLKAQLSDC